MILNEDDDGINMPAYEALGETTGRLPNEYALSFKPHIKPVSKTAYYNLRCNLYDCEGLS